ncbi:neprilysin-1-like [Ixodes scapularis]|uniref:neprilysin-1-like n=1 Tax=Ixodes scapularis TaxID=6945 RepID=UPI001C390790|nr:neprilysin-1-like [Ixodes scapularis]
MAHLHLSEQMAEYEVRKYEDLQFLHPLLIGLYGSTQAVGFGTRVLVKNPKFLRKLEELLEHNRIQLHQYMVVLSLLHLSPFLRVVEPVGLFLSSLNGLPISPDLPNRETLCLHLAERTLPNLLQMAYERIFNSSLLFDELMGDVMVEEVRNALLEHIQSLNLMDAWTKVVAKIKTKNAKVYSFYPVALAQPATLADYVAKVDVPVGFFNISVPTNPRERMFHVPRAAPRLVGCFLRVLLENINFYEPEGPWWTEKTRALVEERTSCLQRSHEALADAKHPQRKAYDPPYLGGLNHLEDTLSVRVALKVYDDLLYTNRYLDRDYRLVGAEHISSKQLFFIYFARSMCEVPDTLDRFMNSHLSSKNNGIYRVNVALMNNREFADAFGCAAGTRMAPAEPCSVWKCNSGLCAGNRLA